MKNKKKLTFLIVILAVIVLLTATAATAIKTMQDRGFTLSKGTLYIKDGTVYLIDGSSATIISDCTENKTLFDRFENGNEVLLLHDLIETTLPQRTGGYFMLRLSYGSSDFSPDIKGLGEAVDSKLPESPPKFAEDLAFSAHYVRTDGSFDGTVFPKTVVIRSKKELDAYYEKNKDNYALLRKSDLYEGATEDGFLDVCDAYDEKFFKNKSLVMVIFEEASGSIRHRVNSVELYPNNVLGVSISTIVPEAGTDDMARWHVIIELDRSKVPKRAEDIAVYSPDHSSADETLKKEVPDSFFFCLRWGTYGISYYSSYSGTLVKTKDTTHPEDYLTEYHLTPAELQGIYNMIQYLDIESYPDEYDPHGNVRSIPYMTIELSVRDKDFEKTVTVPETSLSYYADNKKGQKFLDVCRYIEDILTETEEWKALPDYEFLYD